MLLTAALAHGKGPRFGARAHRRPPFKEVRPLANPELGSKQICPNCQAKFYDLNRRPAHCPKCETEFDPDEAVRNRRVRARAITPEPDEADDQVDQVKARDEDEDEEEDVVTPELDEVAGEPPLGGEDEDEDGVEPGAAPGGDDLTEFSDDEEVEDEGDMPFIEEDEDDDFDDSEIDGLPDEGDDER